LYKNRGRVRNLYLGVIAPRLGAHPKMWRSATTLRTAQAVYSFKWNLRCHTHITQTMSGVGIITTVKRRQEFRIRLQTRARRRVERLLEGAEDERQRQIVCICLLIYLCGCLLRDLARLLVFSAMAALSFVLSALAF